MQLIPLPLTSDLTRLPIDRLLLESAVPPGQITRCASLPFQHAFVHFDGELFHDIPSAADAMHDGYQRALAALGLVVDAETRHIARPYNVLVTRAWLLVVPRSRECFQGVSLNALAFAGALLVHSEPQLAQIQATGWLSILREVAQPVDATYAPLFSRRAVLPGRPCSCIPVWRWRTYGTRAEAPSYCHRTRFTPLASGHPSCAPIGTTLRTSVQLAEDPGRQDLASRYDRPRCHTTPNA